jgi:hypothetical protein
MQRAVCLKHTQHDAAAGLLCWKGQQEPWRQAASWRGFPTCGLVHKHTVLNLPPYLVKQYHHTLTSERSKHPSSQPRPHVACLTRRPYVHMSCHAGSDGPGRTRFPRALQSLPNYIPTPSRYVQNALYAYNTALVATSRNPSLLVGYLEAYLGRLELWLQDWRIAINVSNITAALLKAKQPKTQNSAVSSRTNKIGRNSSLSWIEPRHTAYLVGTCQPGGKEGSSQIERAWSRPKQETLLLCQILSAALQAASPPYDGLRLSDLLVRCLQPRPDAAVSQSKCLALRLTHLGTLVTGKLSRIWGSTLSLPHQSTDRDIRLIVHWCGEPLISATCKVLLLTTGQLNYPTVNRGEEVLSKPAEAVPQKRAKSAQPAV